MPKSLLAIEDVEVQDWVTNSPITSGKLERDYLSLKETVNRIIEFLRDMEKRFATGEPIDKVNGVLWYDAANALLKLYRSSAWENILTEGTIVGLNLPAGGGTATGKWARPIQINATGVQVAGADGDLMTYTLPANTLNVNGRYVQDVCWFINDGAGNTDILKVFGTETLYTRSTSSTNQYVFYFTIIVRTASGAQKWAIFVRRKLDNMGPNAVLVDSGTASQTETSAIIMKHTADQGAGNSITQHGEVLEWQ